MLNNKQVFFWRKHLSSWLFICGC